MCTVGPSWSSWSLSWPSHPANLQEHPPPCPPTYTQKPPSMPWAYAPSAHPTPCLSASNSPSATRLPKAAFPAQHRALPPSPRFPCTPGQSLPFRPAQPPHSCPAQSHPPGERTTGAWPLRAGLPESSSHRDIGPGQTWKPRLLTLVTEMQSWGEPSLPLTRPFCL